jgi:hypothetical protein
VGDLMSELIIIIFIMVYCSIAFDFFYTARIIGRFKCKYFGHKLMGVKHRNFCQSGLLITGYSQACVRCYRMIKCGE